MSLSALRSRLMRRYVLHLCLVALLLVSALVALVLTRHDTPAAHASGNMPQVSFLHTATPANSASDYTRLDDAVATSDLANNPNAFLLVTPNLAAGGGSSFVYDNHPIGVFHDRSSWYIFNQDLTPIPDGATFNVYAYPSSFAESGPGYDDGDIVQTTTSASGHPHYTCINNPNLNLKPNLELQVTPNWNPGSAAGVYDPHPIGVFYLLGNWCIFNQDLAPMPVGAAFNVSYGEAGFGHEGVQTATSTNSGFGITFINDAFLNGNPGAVFFVTSVWNPGGSGGGVDNNANHGVFYCAPYWCIINQGATMPLGAEFFYWVSTL